MAVLSGAAAALLSLVFLSACSTTTPAPPARSHTVAPLPTVTLPPPEPGDAEALRQVKSAAARSAQVDGTVTDVECWSPSRHLVRDDPTVTDGETFRVICRVHYDQGTTARYKDMTCIGDLSASPMLNHCYRWAFYSDAPRFEDGPRLATPPATPPADRPTPTPSGADDDDVP